MPFSSLHHSDFPQVRFWTASGLSLLQATLKSTCPQNLYGSGFRALEDLSSIATVGTS